MAEQDLRALQEPWTPMRAEQELVRLYNEVAKAELELRRYRNAEVDAKLAYEREHIVTTMSPNCPRVERGAVTVDERSDWIKGVEFQQYEAYEQAKKSTKNIVGYQQMLSEQTSIVQTMSKLILVHYGSSSHAPENQ